MNSLIARMSMEEFCEVVGLPASQVIEIVEHGIVEPEGAGHAPENWQFGPHALIVARRATRLRRELELGWAAIALALQLLDDVDHLRQENHMLRQRLGRFVVV